MSFEFLGIIVLIMLSDFTFRFVFPDNIHAVRSADILYKCSATGVSNFGRGSNKSSTMTSTDNSVSYCTRRYVLADCSLRMHGTLHDVGGGLWELVVASDSTPTMIEATHAFCSRRVKSRITKLTFDAICRPRVVARRRVAVPELYVWILFRQVNRGREFSHAWSRWSRTFSFFNLDAVPGGLEFPYGNARTVTKNSGVSPHFLILRNARVCGSNVNSGFTLLQYSFVSLFV